MYKFLEFSGLGRKGNISCKNTANANGINAQGEGGCYLDSNCFAGKRHKSTTEEVWLKRKYVQLQRTKFFQKLQYSHLTKLAIPIDS